MWQWMVLFLRTGLFFIWVLTLSLLLKLSPRKLGPWFVQWSFFLLSLLCISVNLPYNLAWNTTFMSGLMLLAATWEFWDKVQKWVCRIVGLSLAASFEPLARCRNVASLTLFCRYYFRRYSSELAELVPLPYSRGWSTRHSHRLHDFSVTIPRYYKDVNVNSFFLRTVRPWN